MSLKSDLRRVEKEATGGHVCPHCRKPLPGDPPISVIKFIFPARVQHLDLYATPDEQAALDRICRAVERRAAAAGEPGNPFSASGCQGAGGGEP